MNKEYRVTIRSFTYVVYNVEASSKQEAENIATQKKIKGETPDNTGVDVQIEAIEQEKDGVCSACGQPCAPNTRACDLCLPPLE